MFWVRDAENKKTFVKRLPKIIDLFLFNCEFEYLDIKLHEIYRDIDFFAIAESNETFTDRSKPLYLRTTHTGSTEFMDKIHYIQVPPMPADNIRANETVRGREHHTRDKAFRIVLDGLHVQKGDWIIVSDIDEIFRPTILQTMRAPDPGASPMDEIFVDRLVSQGGSWVISFGLRYYRYAYDVYLGTRSTPVAMRYREQASHLERVALSGMEGVMYKKSKELFTRIGENDWATKGQQIRNCGGAAGHAMKVDDAGWRCSWCFGNMSQFLAKMDTYNHREYDTSEHRRKPSITVSTGTINFIEWAVLDHRFVDFLLPWDNGSGGNACIMKGLSSESRHVPACSVIFLNVNKGEKKDKKRRISIQFSSPTPTSLQRSTIHNRHKPVLLSWA